MKKAFIVLLIAIVSITALVSCNPEPKENHTHDYSKEVVDAKYLKDAATCTTKAVYYKSCECGEKGTETFESGDASHSVTKTEAAAATCTAAGNNEYWTCSVCTKLFAEEECETELTAEDVTISKIAHTMTHHDAVAATCIAAGTAEYYECSECEKNYSDEQGTTELTTVDVAKAAHVDANSDGICDNCGYDAANSRIAVGTFAMFAQAFDSAVANEVTDIVLTADIAWDQEAYPGSASNGMQAANALVVDASGLTLDLDGHSITAMVPQGINIKGSNITIKNGAFMRDDAKFTDLANNRWGLSVNYSTSNKAANQEYEQNVTLKDINTNAGLNLGYIQNVTLDHIGVTSDTYRPLCLLGTQNVTIKDSQIFKIGSDTTGAALMVTQSGSATFTGTSIVANNVSSGAVYALSITGGASATGASVTIAKDANVSISTVANTAKAAPVYLTYGANLTVAEDATLNLSSGNTVTSSYANGTGVFYYTGKDADSAGRSSVVNNGTINITVPNENNKVVAFVNNSPSYCVFKLASGSSLTVGGAELSTLETVHFNNLTNVSIVDAEDAATASRLTIYDLR